MVSDWLPSGRPLVLCTAWTLPHQVADLTAVLAGLARALATALALAAALVLALAFAAVFAFALALASIRMHTKK